MSKVDERNVEATQYREVLPFASRAAQLTPTKVLQIKSQRRHIVSNVIALSPLYTHPSAQDLHLNDSGEALELDENEELEDEEFEDEFEDEEFDDLDEDDEDWENEFDDGLEDDEDDDE